MLPGLTTMGVFSAGTIDLVAMTNINSTATANITVPSNVIQGDLMVLFQVGGNQSSFPAAVTPTGFTNLISRTLNGNDEGRGMLDYKVALGTEANTVLTGISGSRTNEKTLVIFRRGYGTSWGTPYGAVGSTNGRTISLTASGTKPAVAVAFYGSRNGGPFAADGTMTTLGERFSPDGARTFGYYMVQEPTPSNLGFNVTSGGSDWMLTTGAYFPVNT